jgi:chromosome partitioning protein
MPVIVANPKGGVGKMMLSTNLAGYLATRGRAVMLGDADRQQSSRTWLGLRPDCRDHVVEAGPGENVRLPRVTHIVLDAAGLHGKRLDEVMKFADKVMIPLLPTSSTFTRRTSSWQPARPSPQRWGAARGRRHAHARRHDLDRPAA